MIWSSTLRPILNDKYKAAIQHCISALCMSLYRCHALPTISRSAIFNLSKHTIESSDVSKSAL